MKETWNTIKNRSVKWLDRNTPPGYPWKNTLTTWYVAIVFSFIRSLGWYLDYDKKTILYLYEIHAGSNGERVLQEGAIMIDFIDLLEGTMDWFWLTALACIAVVVLHHNYHFQGSKSVYLMKRLPNKNEMRRRCLTLPVVLAAASILTMLMLVLLYYAVYMTLTPEQCIAPGQWEKLWSPIAGRQGGI